MNPENVKRILVVVLDNVGDAIMASSVLSPLRKLYPAVTVGLWVKKYASAIFEDQSMIDEVFASDPFWDVSPGHGKGSVGEFWKTLKQIRKRKYDLVFVLNADWRRSLACWLAGVPFRVGYKRKRSQFFLTHALEHSEKVEHYVDQHRALLEFWAKTDVSPELAVPRIEATPHEKKWGEDLINQKNWSENIIVALHVFSGDPLKTWPGEQWVALMKSLWKKNSSLRFLLICGPGETPKIEPHIKSLAQDRIHLLEGPLNKVKGPLLYANVLVGGDSGIGHLAASLGIPVLTLYSITDPRRTSPRGPMKTKKIVNENINDVEVKDVLSQIDEFVTRKSSLPVVSL